MRLRRRLVALGAGAFVVAVPLLQASSAQAFTGTAQAKVFEPNPVVTLRNESLTDQKDADYAALQPAYKIVTLMNLDGSGLLRGDYADVCGTKSCASSSSGTYLFGRDHTWFEQVTSYYAVTQAQLYIQSLGFTNVNNEPQLVRADQFGGDVSFYDPKKDTITVGKGGVDDGEDLEVIWHEYGHAIQGDQVPGFGGTHGNSIGEGFGDYWAFTMSEPVSGGFDPACIADWDSVSYTVGDPVHCLRRVDLDLTVDDQTGDIHDDGQIWSRALYDIHNALGRQTADRIILQAQFAFGVDPSFAEAAQATVDAARSIAGQGAVVKVRKAFQDRGIL
jgi:thermolysin metallopeptidase-like protein